MVSSVQILGRARNPGFRHGLAAIVAASALLAGCGQKGALYLPVPPKVPGALPTAPAPAETSTTLPAPPPAAITPVLPASAAR
ncbi:LPS translocon maturation chaperone LptM [Polaromonas sp. LjRoot131]|uniref:LPS translocon maturation chaperone LptM n=1 Tax=Polaromonas sp. LjRoot131 TaxID=3342262 RepID=UPI003ECE7AC9